MYIFLLFLLIIFVLAFCCFVIPAPEPGSILRIILTWLRWILNQVQDDKTGKVSILLLLIICPLSLQAQEAPNVNVTQIQPAFIPQPDLTTTTTAATAQQVIPSPKALPPGAELIQPKEIKDEKKDKEEPSIYLNFENASLLSVVNYLGEQKKINLLPHKDLEAAKVSLTTRNPLTLERAWNVLLTLLEMNNFSIIKVGPLYRVVPSKDNGFEPLPTYSSGTGTEPEDLPASDMVVRYIYFFKNISAEMAQGILQKMVADEKSVLINKDLKCCIIKEQCFNIKAAMRIVKELDLGGLREQIKIIHLTHVNVDTVYGLFKDILQLDKEDKGIRFIGPSTQQERTYFSSSTKMYPDPAKNNLILLGTEKNLNKITEFIYKNLDVPLGDAASRLHLYELRYADAETLKPILEGIIKPMGGSEKTPIVGEYKFFEDVIIAAEKTTGEGGTERGGGNRLIIACNRDDWKRLVNFIEKLDKPQPQVALEIMIINVNNQMDQSLGAQNYDFKGKDPGMGIQRFETYNLTSGNSASAATSTDVTDAITKAAPTGWAADKIAAIAAAGVAELAKGSSAVSSAVSKAGGNTAMAAAGARAAEGAKTFIQLAGEKYLGGAGHPTYITLGKSGTADTENIWSLIQAKFNLSNTNIVAQPYVVTSNNKPCTVKVANTSMIPGALESKKGEPSVQKKEKVQALTEVKITPRINLEGIVDLAVEIKVDEFQTTGDQPTTLTRAMTTRATLFTGEVLVLGGLTKGDDSETISKTPLLGDLPIIGNLFKSKTKAHTDTNLYVFIRPSIIKPKFEGGADEYSQLKLDYAKYQMMRNDTYAKDRDPIQRWFFKPMGQTGHQALIDRVKGIFRPIDDYSYGKEAPKSVVIKQDPYFKVSEAITEQKKLRSLNLSKKKKKKKKKSDEESGTMTIKLT